MITDLTVRGWRCAVCGTSVDINTPEPWRCPRATTTDRHHVLHPVVDRADPTVAATRADAAGADPHPFRRYDRHLAWAASAATRGMDRSARFELIDELDEAVRQVDGMGFHETPFGRSDEISRSLGFDDHAGIWVKDETGGVGGSQKARHLLSALLQLCANERLNAGDRVDRIPLAISSCGNAALAASTLARAADWPIDVYVPTWISNGFARELNRLEARVHRCERRPEDPPGDPAMHRFLDAVTEGAIPFTVQGPENALCLDGGRTIGWEIADRLVSGDADDGLDAMFVQVGGGAFATCLGMGLAEFGHRPRLMAVQAAGCAPLSYTWQADATAASEWREVMVPWPEPYSLADGIIDDETYDWIGVVNAIRHTAGDVVVAAEERIRGAWEIAKDAGYRCSPTGSAGLAGVLELLDGPEAATWRQRRVGVVISGVAR